MHVKSEYYGNIYCIASLQTFHTWDGKTKEFYRSDILHRNSNSQFQDKILKNMQLITNMFLKAS